MSQQEILKYFGENPNKFFLSEDLVSELGISRTAIIRALTKLADSNMIYRIPIKPKGFKYGGKDVSY